MRRSDAFTYDGQNRSKISFPLGGIGTGSIGLSGSGRLIDWEIHNRPAKGSTNGFSHFAIRAEQNGKVLDARMLNGPYLGDRTGEFQAEESRNYGTGARRDSLAGMPHFETCRFLGRFPTACITLADARFPGVVEMAAFNPFIPLNDRDSSIPAAMFAVTVFNTTDAPIDYTVIGVLAACRSGRAAIGWAEVVIELVGSCWRSVGRWNSCGGDLVRLDQAVASGEGLQSTHEQRIWLRSCRPGRTSASCSTPWSRGSTRRGRCPGRGAGTVETQALI